MTSFSPNPNLCLSVVDKLGETLDTINVEDTFHRKVIQWCARNKYLHYFYMINVKWKIWNIHGLFEILRSSTKELINILYTIIGHR